MQSFGFEHINQQTLQLLIFIFIFVEATEKAFLAAPTPQRADGIRKRGAASPY